MNKFVSEKEIRQERIRQLMEHCESSILDGMIGPFGLHHAMFEDKDGGNLPTQRNAQNNIFPNQTYAENFSGYNPEKCERQDYDKPHMRGAQWREINRKFDSGEIVTDSYSGKALEKGNVNMDHVIPVKEHSKNPTLHLWFSKEERQRIVNDDSNLAPTSEGINKKKSAMSVESYLNSDRLHPDVVHIKIKERDDVARSQLLKTETARIITDAGSEIGKDGLKLGVRQGIGIVLRVTTQATFIEVKDVYINGIDTTSTYIDDLKLRAERIKAAAMASAKHALKGGALGAISGVVSELLTWLINQWVSTAKNIVRIVREGILKLVEAIKLILTRPADMSLEEALRAAVKIISGVLGLAIGIAAEESLKAMLLNMPFVNAFATEIAAVMSAILSGILIGVVVFMIDTFFDKLSMPFTTQSLDLLSQNGQMQQQLLENIASVSKTYALTIEKLGRIEVDYSSSLADTETVIGDYEAMLEESRTTNRLLLGGIK